MHELSGSGHLCGDDSHLISIKTLIENGPHRRRLDVFIMNPVPRTPFLVVIIVISFTGRPRGERFPQVKQVSSFLPLINILL